MSKVTSIFSIWFRVVNYHLFHPEQFLWARGDEAIISDRGKRGLKDTYLASGLDTMDTELSLKLFNRIILNKPYNNQPFTYKNHCKHYKKVASRFWPMLFTLTKFFLIIHSPLLKEIKISCDCCFSQ